MRTFIAIELPPEIRDILSNLQSELKQTQADLKWVKPENIHLTLRFLGEIKEDLVKKVQLTLEGIAQKSAPFSVYLAHIGAFPKLEYARVIWIGLTNHQPILKLAGELEEELIKIGLDAESRPFSSHITLGRVRSGKNRKALTEKIEFLNQNLPSPQPEFKVLSLTFFKSTLTGQGPIYEALARCPLKA